MRSCSAPESVHQTQVFSVLSFADCPVVGGACISVADRDREKFEELFAGRWAGTRDDGWSCERIC